MIMSIASKKVHDFRGVFTLYVFPIFHEKTTPKFFFCNLQRSQNEGFKYLFVIIEMRTCE